MSTKLLVPIENTSLVRDMSSNAVLNTDTEGQSRYKALHQKRTAELKENNETKRRLQEIEQELATIKSLMMELSQMSQKQTV